MIAALAGGKVAGLVSRRIGHGGTALPGLVAERLDPLLLSHVGGQLGLGAVLVTGTNGKTTTARMIAAAGSAVGLHVLHNRSGSNLIRGLTATAVKEAGWRGTLPAPAHTIGVLEVDEATLPQAVSALHPRAVVFTNLFRDQLDRYGEVDSIAAIWRRGLDLLDPTATVVVNADDPSVASLGEHYSGQVLSFGVDDIRLAGGSEHAADSRWCASCGGEYSYSALYFGHIGLWSCPQCGRQRSRPQISATCVDLHPGEVSRMRAETPMGSINVDLPLDGLYNVCNALAAIAGGIALGLPLQALESALSGFDAAFGRQERMTVRGREVRLLLCKNPAGVNQVLRLIVSEPGPHDLLILLNDGIADGRDISWIWDVDYELLVGHVDRVVVSGQRASDMALRLKYAGLGDSLVVDPDPRVAAERALALVPAGGSLSVLPTYTAMLSVREQFARLAGRSRYWED
jgi:UDP-N-acetylmuramyl tripeptide synthase